jgi:hypothetical protein
MARSPNLPQRPPRTAGGPAASTPGGTESGESRSRDQLSLAKGLDHPAGRRSSLEARTGTHPGPVESTGSRAPGTIAPTLRAPASGRMMAPSQSRSYTPARNDSAYFQVAFFFNKVGKPSPGGKRLSWAAFRGHHDHPFPHHQHYRPPQGDKLGTSAPRPRSSLGVTRFSFNFGSWGRHRGQEECPGSHHNAARRPGFPEERK